MKLQLYQDLFNSRHLFANTSWQTPLQRKIEDVLSNPSHGHFPMWQATVNQIPSECTDHVILNASEIKIGNTHELSKQQHDDALDALRKLLPWRKGPFNFFGTTIDSEWRCDKKWNRIRSCIPSLKDKTILDIGCGNGYYMLRMLGAGAKTVIGVDPTLLFLAQYYSITQCLTKSIQAFLLPITFEKLPQQMNEFDIIFSMGVLYHRREPQDHLQQLFLHTKPGGTIVLETLIFDDPESTSLIPEDRYAGMRNVWCIPSPSRIIEWLTLSNFKNIQLHGIDVTNFEEQRATSWTNNYSLENFLHPTQHDKTIEGYPRPTRAIFTATRSH